MQSHQTQSHAVEGLKQHCLHIFFLFTFNVLGANRQSSVHAILFSQNIAPMGKQLLMKPLHAFGSHLAKKSDTEEVC